MWLGWGMVLRGRLLPRGREWVGEAGVVVGFGMDASALFRVRRVLALHSGLACGWYDREGWGFL